MRTRTGKTERHGGKTEMRGGKNANTYEGLQEYAQTANKSYERYVSGQLIYSGSDSDKPLTFSVSMGWGAINIKFFSHPFVQFAQNISSSRWTCRRYPDHDLMRLSLSATFISFGGHNIYRGSNCRFCSGWTDGQTEFTVIISPNVAADDVALHADDEMKKSSLL